MLDEARRRRREVLRICAGFTGVLGTFSSGSVAMGVVIDPVEDADGGMILDRRCYPSLGPDGDGDTPVEVVGYLHDHLGPRVRKTWSEATVHDMKRGVTVRMHEPVWGGQDPFVDVVVSMQRRAASGLWIPNLVAVCWDASHPQCHVELMTSGSRPLRRVRAQVVRLAKAWNKQFVEPALNSFNIVALALECIDTVIPLEVALHRFFEHAAASLAVCRTEDPAGVSGPIKLESTKDVAVARLGAARVERGETTTIVGLAKRSGVSPRFIYNHPDLRAEIERRAAEIGDHLAGRMVASARVTTASLRADLANYKAEVQRQRTEITALRDRLSEALGSSYAAGLPEADRLGLLASRDAQERIAELEQHGFELQERVATQNEELEAVRNLNRELMAKLNTRAKNAN